MKIQSKIGSGMLILTIFVLLCTLATFLVWAIWGNYVPTIIFACISLFFVLPIYLNTSYEIRNGYLYINFGWFLMHYAIPCYDIISMTDAQSICLAPALSGERLRIKYVKNGKIKSIYVSPANKDLFRTLVQEEIQNNFKKAQVSHEQIDTNTLEAVLSKEQKAQAKMDVEEMLAQQKQQQRDIKENSREIRRIEKRAKQAKISEYKTEQKKAIKIASLQIDTQLAKEDNKTNMQRKQLSQLIALHDEQEKRERKLENEKWEREKREKLRQEKAKKKLAKKQKREQEKRERELQKKIQNFEE